MHRLTITKNYGVLKVFCRRGFQTHESHWNKNIVFGGDVKESPDMRSFGGEMYNRLKDPSRADAVIQVCASTGKTMTTQTFLKQSVALAEGLREKNVQKGDFILLVGNNSFNMNIALVGAFILGAVAVPISYFANPDDIKHLLAYIQPKFFICDGQTLFTIRRIVSSVFGELDESRVCLLYECCFPEFIKGKGENWESFKPVEVKNPNEELALVMKSVAEGTAYRGVGLTHTNLLTVISRFEAVKSRAPIEVVLMVQKIIWLSGIYCLLAGCFFGSKMVVMSDFNEEVFMKSIEKHKVTTCFLYAAKLWQLYKYNYPITYDLSSCTRFYAVGSRIPSLLLSLMKEKTGLEIRTAYGMTEMTGLVIEQTDEFKEGSMGKLVPTVYAKVISTTSHQRNGPNIMGEMCFKGPTLMKGYINDEEATRNVIDKEGFLHTGDYGYYDDEGYFFIWDRMKSVIRYKNHEISPMEIEAVLKSLDSVKDCVVGGIRHSTDGQHVVAFVVLQPGKTTTADEIERFIASKLPEHKHIRAGVVFLPKIPRSRESGFIKRGAINRVLSKYRIVSEREDAMKKVERTTEQKKVEEQSKKTSNPAEATVPSDGTKKKK